MKSRILTSIMVAVLLFAGYALAQPGDAQPQQIPQRPMQPRAMAPGFGPGPEWGAGNVFGMQRFMMGMDLDEKQTAKLSEMRLDTQKKMMKIHSDIQTNMTNLKLIMTEDKYSKGDAEKLINKIADLKKDQMKAHFEHMRAVRDILTPEQRVKFDQHILAHKGPGFGGPVGMHRGGMMGNGPMGQGRDRGPRPKGRCW